jgi:hypothetical protein
VALAAVVLVGTGAVFASPSPPSPGAPEDQLATYSSGRASMLLAEIRKESTQLTKAPCRHPGHLRREPPI